MEMVFLALQVLSAAAILVAAVVFYRGVTESKKPVEVKVNLNQPGFDEPALQAQIKLVMEEAISVFRDQVKELARQNAELSQIGVWVNQLKSVDLTKLSDDVAKRVQALRIKKAESAITEAEGALASMREDITGYAVRAELAPAESAIRLLKMKKEQEKHAMEYLNEAQSRLNGLIAEQRSVAER